MPLSKSTTVDSLLRSIIHYIYSAQGPYYTSIHLYTLKANNERFSKLPIAACLYKILRHLHPLEAHRMVHLGDNRIINKV